MDFVGAKTGPPEAGVALLAAPGIMLLKMFEVWVSATVLAGVKVAAGFVAALAENTLLVLGATGLRVAPAENMLLVLGAAGLGGPNVAVADCSAEAEDSTDLVRLLLALSSCRSSTSIALRFEPANFFRSYPARPSPIASLWSR